MDNYNINSIKNTNRYSNISTVNHILKDAHGNSNKSHSSNTKQLLKGEIIDLKNNDIVIRLDDGTKLQAKIYDSSNLNIGQYIKFHVHKTDAGLVIDNFETNQFTENSMIYKALETANLPATERNISIVTELLKHNMSLDKNTILNIQKQTFINKDVNIETIVLLNKHNLPVNKTNAQQFNKYKNYEHRIVKEIDYIANAIPEIFDDITVTRDFSTVLKLNKQLIDIINNKFTSKNTNSNVVAQGNGITTNQSTNANVVAQGNGITTNQSTNANVVAQGNTITINQRTNTNVVTQGNTITANQSANANAVVQDNIITTVNQNPTVATTYLSPTSAIEVASILEKYNIDENLLNDVKTGTASIREVASTILKCLEVADEIDSYRVSKLNAKNANAFTNITLAKDAFSSPTIQSILDKYASLQRDNSEVASFMNNYNRAQLISKLRDVPGSLELTDRIWSGNISSGELLNSLNKIFTTSPKEVVCKILTSSQYKSVIKETILNNWTISPNNLLEDNAIENNYKSMYEQLTKLNNFVNDNNLDKNMQGKLSNNLINTQENIDFMNTLNSMFTYVQIPLKLRNQNIHSDLYVMTNKKNLSKNKSSISVLLHLDMEYLGAMDINIVVNDNNIATTFNVTDQETLDLISTNMEHLEFALMEKGFVLKSNVILKDKTEELIDNFIAKESSVSSIKRYTFDIRT